MDTLRKVKELHAIITSSDHPESVIAAFDHDPNFHAMFNSNGQDCIKNMERYIEASEEGFWQDLITIGPFRALLAPYRESLKRIYTLCSKSKKGIAADAIQGYSMYLPDYPVYLRQIARLDLIYKVCRKIQKDPELSIDSVKDDLVEAGVKKNLFGKFKSMIGINWQAVVKYYNSSYKVSQNGGSLSSKGWTADKLQNAASDMCDRIDKLHEFEEKPAIMEDDVEITPEYKKKITFIKNMYSIYLHDLKLLGRGVAYALVDD